MRLLLPLRLVLVVLFSLIVGAAGEELAQSFRPPTVAVDEDRNVRIRTFPQQGAKDGAAANGGDLPPVTMGSWDAVSTIAALESQAEQIKNTLSFRERTFQSIVTNRRASFQDYAVRDNFALFSSDLCLSFRAQDFATNTFAEEVGGDADYVPNWTNPLMYLNTLYAFPQAPGLTSLLAVDTATRAVSTIALPTPVQDGVPLYASAANYQGKLFAFPNRASNVLIFDVEAGEFVSLPFDPPQGPNSAVPWTSAVTHLSRGVIYAVQATGPNVLALDTNSLLIDFSLSISDETCVGWAAAVLFQSQDVYCAPSFANGDILLISGNGAQAQSSLLPNPFQVGYSDVIAYMSEALYFVPNPATFIGAYYPQSGEAVMIPLSLSPNPFQQGPFQPTFAGIVLLRDTQIHRRLALLPGQDTSAVVIIDPTTNTASVDESVFAAEVQTLAQAQPLFTGIATTLRGQIFGIPQAYPDFMFLDPTLEAATAKALPSDSSLSDNTLCF